MNDNPLKGQRCLGHCRASKGIQKKDSIPQQVEVLMKGCADREMIWVGYEEEITSASDPGNRADIARLLERKRIHDDYDVLLIQEGSRFTRAGPQHAAWLRVEFARVGVTVVRLSSRLVNSRYSWVEEGIEDDAAYDHVAKGSFNSNRGMEYKMKEGLIAHCKAPPFGIDRLYLNADKKPICIIRNLQDGRQLRLHHRTKRVQETYPKEIKNTEPRHFRKQKSYRVVLIPGAEECLEQIRYAFTRYYKDGIGCLRIAREMAERGWRNQTNDEWSQQSVDELVHRTAYTGRGIRKAKATGKFTIQDRESPREVQYDIGEMMNTAHKKTTFRPPDDWDITEYPKLFKILKDDAFRDHVWERQKAWYIQRATNTRPPTNHDKHRSSRYFLKQVLACKHTRKLFCGKNCGKGERYYHLNYFHQYPHLDRPWLKKRIAAEPIENVSKGILRHVLGSSEELRPVISAAVHEEIAKMQNAASDLDSLTNQLTSVDQQIAFGMSQLSELGEDATKKLIGPLKDRRRNLKSAIERREAVQRKVKPDAAKTVESVLIELENIGAAIEGMEPQLLRSLFLSFSDMKVDLEKMELDLDLRLPRWAFDHPEKIKNEVGLVSGLQSSARHEAHTSESMILASYGCNIIPQGKGKRTKPCVKCTRRKAA